MPGGGNANKPAFGLTTTQPATTGFGAFGTVHEGGFTGFGRDVTGSDHVFGGGGELVNGEASLGFRVFRLVSVVVECNDSDALGLDFGRIAVAEYDFHWPKVLDDPTIDLNHQGSKITKDSQRKTFVSSSWSLRLRWRRN